MNQKLRNLRRVFTLLALFPGAAVVSAAPDDSEPPPPADVQVNRGFMMDEDEFDEQIFQGNGNAAASRARINSHLKLKLDELDRVCVLTEVQKQKLRLAAQGDMKRFFDQVEEVRREFLAVKIDPNGRINQVWQEIELLRQKQVTGLFGESSLFAKTVRKTLTGEQQAKYRVIGEERRRFRYRATIEVSLNTLDLRHAQHEALLKLLVEETQPPLVFGPRDHDVVMYRLATLPEEKVRQLLDERQRESLQQRLDHAYRLEKHLVQSGIITVEEPTGTPADALNPERPRRRIEAALQAIEELAADGTRSERP